jgi:hypothetical protein
MIHPIPPNLYCVPAALCALTGEPLDAVVVPALNRAGGRGSLLNDPGPTGMIAAATALREMGCTVMCYKEPLWKERHQLATFAKRWRDKAHPVLVSICGHALVLYRGMVYDTKTPSGCDAARHPDARAILTYAAMVVRR